MKLAFIMDSSFPNKLPVRSERSAVEYSKHRLTHNDFNGLFLVTEKIRNAVRYDTKKLR
jgi:hypothetical protein